MIQTYLFWHPWLAALIWASLYYGDYAFTVIGSNLFKSQTHFLLDGSYELTPESQKVIDRGSWINSSIVSSTVWGVTILTGVGYFLHYVPEWFELTASFVPNHLIYG